MGKMMKIKTFKHECIEKRIYEKRLMRIGKGILSMNYYQRVWWALTGQSKYMLNKYWDLKERRNDPR